MELSVNKFNKKLEELTTSDRFAVLEVSTLYEYVNKQRTDKVIGIKYSVADPETFKNFTVKVPAKQPVVSQGEIDASDTHIWVSFSNAIVKPYKLEYGTLYCSVTADVVQLVK